jgi:hypothetical protein
MAGTGLSAPDRVSLGENARMVVGPGDVAGLLPLILAGPLPAGLNVVNIRFVNGTIEIGGDPIPVQDNLSGGFTESSRANKSCMITADCFFRAADNPFAFPPRFEPMEETQRIIIWPDLLNDPNNYVKLPIGFCLGVTMTLPGAGDVRYSLRLSNQKAFYTTVRPDPKGVFA